MKIEHVAMYVKDLEVAKDFYCKYFNGVSNNKYHNKTTGFESYFISFDTGARFELMSKPNLVEQEEAQNRYGYIHIAFSVGSNEAVDILTNQLENDGYTVTSYPRTTGDGYYESCVLDPDGNVVEITV